MTDLGLPMLNYAVVSGRVKVLHEIKRTKYDSYLLEFVLENTVEVPSSDGGTVPVESLIDVEIWGAMAEDYGKMLTAGCHVIVEGRLASVVFEDRTRIARNRMILRAREVQMLDHSNP